jgi:hypothetical protein
MDYPESTLPYVALVARLEILAESLATEPAIRASVPQVQDREDVVEDPAETSQQGAADSSTDVAGKTWEEVASLLNSIADGLRTSESAKNRYWCGNVDPQSHQRRIVDLSLQRPFHLFLQRLSDSSSFSAL